MALHFTFSYQFNPQALYISATATSHLGYFQTTFYDSSGLRSNIRLCWGENMNWNAKKVNCLHLYRLNWFLLFFRMIFYFSREFLIFLEKFATLFSLGLKVPSEKSRATLKSEDFMLKNQANTDNYYLKGVSLRW